MSSTTRAVRLYRLALFAFPPRLRALYGEEMVAVFAHAHSQRSELGSGAGRRFALRAWLDALRAGAGTRLGGGLGPRGGAGNRRTLRDWLWVEIGFDLRQGMRSLVATPAFTLTVIVVLALGVGVNGALFTAVRAALIDSVPYPDPDRLYLLNRAEQRIGTEEPPRATVWSYPKYRLMEEVEGFAAEPFAAYASRDVTITGRGAAAEVTAEVVTADYFDVLGTPAVVGSSRLGADQVLLSHEYRLALFGDTDPLGEDLVVNGVPMMISGVAPQGFRGLSGRARLWISMTAVPAVISTTLVDNYDGHWLGAVGRLRPGASREQLAQQMAALGPRMTERWEWRDPNRLQTGTARPLLEARRNPRARQAVGVVSAAALLVLLIACANLAVLMYSRGRNRRRELAVRLALGGSRGRVVRGLLAETALLVVAAGLLATLVGATGTGAIASAWPDSFMDGTWRLRFVDASDIHFDRSAALFTFGLAVFTGSAFSLAPVLRLTRGGVATAMRGGSGRTTRGGGSRWLVGAQVAIALILTVGAGLMGSSLTRLVSVEKGFDSRSLLTFDYALGRSSSAAEDPAAFHDEFLRRVRQLPGVVNATVECGRPLGVHCWITGVHRVNEQVFDEGSRRAIGVHLVDEEHFGTIAVPLVAGRNFDANEGAGTPAVTVINESAAREFFPDVNPVGQRIGGGLSLTSESEGLTAEVIGVVGDVLYGSPDEGTMPEMYVLHRQEPGRSTSVIVRTVGEPLEFVALLRAELATIAPDVRTWATPPLWSRC